jgi:hypothetical protein
VTLIVVGGCPAFIVQVSDRRLTWSDGRAPEEEECKAIHLRLPAADFLIGYTGLAKIGSKRTSDVIMEILVDAAAASGYDANRLFETLADELSGMFGSWPIRSLTSAQRRLTVMATGFIYRDLQTIPGPFQVLLTNYQDWFRGDSRDAWPTFRTMWRSPTGGDPWSTLLERVGAWPALPNAEFQTFHALLTGKAPAHAFRDKVIAAMPAIADNHPTVGRELNAAILPIGDDVFWSYHVTSNKLIMQRGDRVVVTPEATFAERGRGYRAVGAQSARPLVVPAVPRRQPCPCGSGRQYRLCHGRAGAGLAR